jgi:hypothetical protein
VEYPEDYCHERFYGIIPGKPKRSMGYQGPSPWLVRSSEGRLVTGMTMSASEDL